MAASEHPEHAAHHHEDTHKASHAKTGAISDDSIESDPDEPGIAAHEEHHAERKSKNSSSQR